MPDARPASPPIRTPAIHWDVRIPMPDGIALSANVWRPTDSDTAPVPAILEHIPYGKDNWRRNADTARGEWFAARGYAFVRLDVRGTGSSEGVALDEYTEQETRDGFDAVEWLAAQPWCTGAVGMFGISYGAFTAIQVAKLRPPHLKAIAPFQGTDDRYLTDVHYIGGCVTASELSQYAVSQVAMNAMPPDAGFRGDAWLDEWRARLDATPPWLVTWLRQQADGPYWRPGSLAPDYDAIEVPIYNVGGWCDAYVDAHLRMQARCSAPSWTLVGNWVHGWPADSPARPQPRPPPRDGPVLRPLAEGRRQRLGRRAGGDLVRTRLRRARAVPRGLAGTLALGRRVSASRDDAPCVGVRRWRRPAPGWAPRRRGRRPRRASTPTGIARPWELGPACRGVPAASRTAWPVTCVPTRRSGRRSPARPSTRRSRSSASRSRSCISRSTPRWPRPSSA